jgi:hypothetical protein
MKRFTDFNGNGLTGGAPFYNEDFYDVELEKYELLKDLFDALVSREADGVQSFVISGMAITANGGNWDVSAGIVYLETAAGREFYRYDGDTNVASATLYLVPAADASENRTYADGVSKEFFVTKKAALGANETGAIVFDPANQGAEILTLSDVLRKTQRDQLTISTGAVTITGPFHAVDTEAAAATDDLITINGGDYVGQELILKNVNSSRRVWIKRGGNIITQRKTDFPLDSTNDRIFLKWDGSNWVEINRVRASGWVNFTGLTNSWASDANYPLQYKVSAFGVVQWRGRIAGGSSIAITTSTAVTGDSLPPFNLSGSGSSSLRVGCWGTIDGAPRAVAITFLVNTSQQGQLSLITHDNASYTYGAGDTIYFDGITYENNWSNYAV